MVIVYSAYLLAGFFLAFVEPDAASEEHEDEAEQVEVIETDEQDRTAADRTPFAVSLFLGKIRSQRKPFRSLSLQEQVRFAEIFREALAAVDQELREPEIDESRRRSLLRMKLDVLGRYANFDTIWKPQAIAFRAELLKEYPDSEFVPLVASQRIREGSISNGARNPSQMRRALSEFANRFRDHPEAIELYIDAASHMAEGGQRKLALELCDEGRQRFQGNPEAARLRGITFQIDPIGQEMDFVAPMLDGSEFDMAALRGKVVLVNFWATWCTPCIQDLPRVLAIRKEFESQGLEVVHVSLDRQRASLERFLESNDLPGTVICQDPRVARPRLSMEFGVRSIPRKFVVARDGRVAAVVGGGVVLSRDNRQPARADAASGTRGDLRSIILSELRR